MNDATYPEPKDGEQSKAEASASATAAAPPVAANDDRLAELEAELAKMKDQALRALAEAENTRRRAEREREDASKYGVSQLARDLLSVADNLHRAIEAVEPESVQQDAALTNLLTGVQATERELFTALERRGIRKIEAMGEKFDPNFHQAMFEVATADQPPGTVVQVLQPGYLIHDRLLRPALVGVAKPPSPNGPEHVNTQV